jgi:hypothetical protein
VGLIAYTGLRLAVISGDGKGCGMVDVPRDGEMFIG